jgi:hypothetical protein
MQKIDITITYQDSFFLLVCMMVVWIMKQSCLVESGILANPCGMVRASHAA